MQQQNFKTDSFSNLRNDQIINLAKCMIITKACSKMCIDEGRKETAVICNECSEICDLALKFKSYGSKFLDQILHLCQDICKKCASECEKQKVDHCKECAEMCKQCLESCSKEHSSSCEGCQGK